MILRQVFDENEVVIIKREVDELFAENRDGRSAGDDTQYVQPFFERKRFLATLVEDGGLWGYCN